MTTALMRKCYNVNNSNEGAKKSRGERYDAPSAFFSLIFWLFTRSITKVSLALLRSFYMHKIMHSSAFLTDPAVRAVTGSLSVAHAHAMRATDRFATN